jgi:hypothetical protein
MVTPEMMLGGHMMVGGKKPTVRFHQVILVGLKAVGEKEDQKKMAKEDLQEMMAMYDFRKSQYEEAYEGMQIAGKRLEDARTKLLAAKFTETIRNNSAT